MGSHSLRVVEQALADFGIAADKIVGVVLNKVNFRELDTYSRGYYHNKHYAKYGYTYSEGLTQWVTGREIRECAG